MDVQTCSFCGVHPVKADGKICARCRDEQIKKQDVLPVDRPKRPRCPPGPPPNAGKMLRDHIRMLQTVQADIAYELYNYDAGGVRIRGEQKEREKLAERMLELGREIVPAAKEERQWREADFAKGKNLKPAEIWDLSIQALSARDVPEDTKRRAVTTILESLGERAVKAVP